MRLGAPGGLIANSSAHCDQWRDRRARGMLARNSWLEPRMPFDQLKRRGFLTLIGAAEWIEGRNLQIEDRWGAGNADRLRALADELVRLDLDAIMVGGSLPLKAALDVSRTMPIWATRRCGRRRRGAQQAVNGHGKRHARLLLETRF